MRKLICLASSALMLAMLLNNALAAGENYFDEIRVEFELVGANGELVTEQSFRHRYVLLAFGFTNCAHICPMMAANMAMALKASQQDAVGVFISVDISVDIQIQYATCSAGFGEKFCAC
jgi:protein SCO1/2